MTTTELKIAELHPDQIEAYERLHREIPEANLLGLLEGGYRTVRIHRIGTLLVMRVEHDEARRCRPSAQAEAAALEWKHLTERMFARLWADATEVFRFDAHDFEGTLERD